MVIYIYKRKCGALNHQQSPTPCRVDKKIKRRHSKRFHWNELSFLFFLQLLCVRSRMLHSDIYLYQFVKQANLSRCRTFFSSSLQPKTNCTPLHYIIIVVVVFFLSPLIQRAQNADIYIEKYAIMFAMCWYLDADCITTYFRWCILCSVNRAWTPSTINIFLLPLNSDVFSVFLL